MQLGGTARREEGDPNQRREEGDPNQRREGARQTKHTRRTGMLAPTQHAHGADAADEGNAGDTR